MYDNTKMILAFEAWLDENVEIGYGEQYAGDLLDDFDDFLRKTKMLKRNPGRVAFGKLMNDKGFDKRKRMGLTYYFGLELKNKPEGDALAPKRYSRTLDAMEEQHKKRQQIKREAEFEESDEARKARIAAFKRELQEETAEKIRKVGYQDD